MPQGIFAWQEKGHREAHPEGERETGRRPRERESTFLGEKPVPDASGGGLSLCRSLGQERGKKTPLGAGGGGIVPDISREGLSLCEPQGQERGKKTPLGDGGGGIVPDISREGLSLCASQGQERGKKNYFGGRGRRACSPRKGKGKGLGSISQAFPSFRGGGAALSRGLYYFNESFP